MYKMWSSLLPIGHLSNKATINCCIICINMDAPYKIILSTLLNQSKYDLPYIKEFLHFM